MERRALASSLQFDKIQRSLAITLEIERHERESERLENRHKLACHFGREGALQFFGGNLDADQLVMMSHAKLAEAQGAHRFFSLLHDPQALPLDLPAVRELRGN